MAEKLYPMSFKTIFKDKIWGGTKIKEVLGKDFSPLPNCGETWELSGVKGDISEVANGFLAGTPLTELTSKYRERLLGSEVVKRFGAEFPLLIKFIDAADDLSIQVHPDDRLAEKRHQGKGKTEMWYILQSDPGAELYVGFNRKIDGVEYKKRVEENTILEVMHKEPVSAGDIFFIPAGRVHSIGKGIMLAEIQQTSDITYRIYDFDRKDASGKGRELHIDLAADAMDYTLHPQYKSPYRKTLNKQERAVECEFFVTDVLQFKGQISPELFNKRSFAIFVCTSGGGIIRYDGQEYPMNPGDVYLIPAEIEGVELESAKGCSILVTGIPEA